MTIHFWFWRAAKQEPLTVAQLKTRRRRKRERHLKMSVFCNHFFLQSFPSFLPLIIFQLFRVIMFQKCVLTILELNWNQRQGHKKTKLNICHHMLLSSKLNNCKNRSFHVVERTRTSSKCQMMKNARAKRAKILFFIFVGFLLPSSSCSLMINIRSYNIPFNRAESAGYPG